MMLSNKDHVLGSLVQGRVVTDMENNQTLYYLHLSFLFPVDREEWQHPSRNNSGYKYHPPL